MNAEMDNNGNFIFNLPKTLQDKLIAENAVSFTIRGGGLFITFDMEAIRHIRTTANADVTVTATKTANSTLSPVAQAATGGRPVYDFKVTGGGKNITTFGGGKLSLHSLCTAKAG